MPGQRSKPTERVVRLLDTLRSHAGAGLRFADLARTGGLSQATCHAILLTLADAGYVVRDDATRTYSLGPALVALGDAAGASFPDVRASAAELARLAAVTGCPVSAARVVDGAITVVEVVGPGSEALAIRPGTRVPCAPPFGAIHVAWDGAEAVAAWIARASSPTLTAERLRAVIDDHRRTRVAIAPYTASSAALREALGELAADTLSRDVRDRTLALLAAIDELDYSSGALDDADRLAVNTLTAPVFGLDGRVSFAVAIHVAQPDLAVTQIRALAGELHAATERMTTVVGGRRPDDAERATTEPESASPARASALTGRTS
jgi:DNA-binding IclR family transcriptional regulator